VKTDSICEKKRVFEEKEINTEIELPPRGEKIPGSMWSFGGLEEIVEEKKDEEEVPEVWPDTPESYKATRIADLF
jgi:hypothetical protein